MSAELSLYGANHVLDGTAMPATLYVKAHTGNPTNAGTANPATETTRKAFTRVAAAAGATSNVATLTWLGAAASETWSHWSAWDASSGGNCWIVGTCSPPIVVTAGDTVRCAIGDLDLSLTVWA